MKRSHLIVAVVVTVFATALLCCTASANYWDENPFTDVPSESWYYESVRFCKENGIFAGTGDTSFSPDSYMTRAMLVTSLASTDGYDAAAYNKPTFSDVKSGTWYYGSVCWAYENGIVSGVSADRFSPNTRVTREQAALILRKYAIYKGLSDGKTSSDLAKYEDGSSVSEWAREALSWANEHSIMSSTSSQSSLISPKGFTKRSAFSVMLRRLFALKPTFTICGNDISLYSIVIPDSPAQDVTEASQLLRNCIKQVSGVTLPIVSDRNDVEYAISLGRTGLVDEEMLSGVDELQFICKARDGDFFICGRTDTQNVRGTLYGVYYFAEKKLGISFFADDLIKYNPDPIIDIYDGYSYIDGPYLETRLVYWQKGWDKVYFNDTYSDELFVVTPMGQLINGYDYPYYAPTPCLSDKNNLDNMVGRIREELLKTNTRTLRLFPNDDYGYCQCDACMKAYREDGSRCATIIGAANYVSNALTPEFPELSIFTSAYTYAINPPKKTVCNDNVYIYFIAVTNCASHLFDDTSCTANANFMNNVEGWKKVTKKIYFWDHSTDFYYTLCPFPNIYAMKHNTALFCDYNGKGIFNNAVAARSGESGDLRAFLITRLYREPYMSDDKYSYLIDRFLEAYYGKGWKNIRTYLDLIESMKQDVDYNFYPSPGTVFDYEEVRENADYILSLWEETAALAETEQEIEHVRCTSIAPRYLVLCARYETDMVGGTPEQQEAYRKANQEMYDDIVEFNVCWAEFIEEPPQFDPSKSPESWNHVKDN